jgi:hypothetical protein
LLSFVTFVHRARNLACSDTDPVDPKWRRAVKFNSLLFSCIVHWMMKSEMREIGHSRLPNPLDTAPKWCPFLVAPLVTFPAGREEFFFYWALESISLRTKYGAPASVPHAS